MTRVLLTILTALAMVALPMLMPATVFADDVRLEADLSPTDVDPGASGRARFESDRYDTQFRVEVQNVSVTDTVDVFVNGDFVGTIVLNYLGQGELDLDARNGDTVPALQDGDEVEVVDAADDTTLILVGILNQRRH
jgi:hypothetical protein